jgi:hypothetical protein
VTAGRESPADGKRLGVQMSKKIGLVAALVGLGALSVFVLSCGSSSSRPSGVLYVVTQGVYGYGNNVSSFSIDLDTGNLSLVNSNASTCPTVASQSNSEPCGIPLDILLSPTGATAFVLNQGIASAGVAPTIYSYSVNSDGSLGSPTLAATLTTGDTPVAMARDAAGQFLFVIDQGSFPPPGYPNPSPSNPSCPHIPTGASDVCPSISVFAMQGSTGLTEASGSPFYLSKIPSALSPIAFTPQSGTAEELLFVTNNLDICTTSCVLPQHSDNTVSEYAVSSSGVLTEQSYSPYIIAAPNPISVLAVNTNPAGQDTGGLFVYVGNQGGSGAGALNPFQVCTGQNNSTCTPQDVEANLMSPLMQVCAQPPCNNVAPTPAGQNPIQMLVDPTNNFLYVIAEDSNQLLGFHINTTAGTLAPLSPAYQPTGLQPVSVTIHVSINATGQYLYTSNNGSDNVSGFTMGTTSGALGSPITVITPATPSGLTAH